VLFVPTRADGILVPEPRAMATLKGVYDRFTKQPNSNDLHATATLSYISSGTNVTGANEIVQFVLRSKNDVQVTEDVLSYHVGHNSLTVEIAAECKFKNGPSWVAPGVDGNLIDQMIVKLPLVLYFTLFWELTRVRRSKPSCLREIKSALFVFIGIRLLY
jgi:hypothetical protein